MKTLKTRLFRIVAAIPMFMGVCHRPQTMSANVHKPFRTFPTIKPT
jgi:hypothetical protein